MVNATNTVTEAKKNNMRSPQSLKWALVLHFADAVAGLWYIKATTVFAEVKAESCEQTAKTGEVVEDPGCQYPALRHTRMDYESLQEFISLLFFLNEDQSFWG